VKLINVEMAVCKVYVVFSS